MTSRREAPEVRETRLLVTGFGPYDATDDNPSTHVARGIDPDANILTVAYADVEMFLKALKPESFDVWLMLGYSKKAKKLVLEQTARNEVKDRLDARGVSKSGLIDPDGPETISATLWPRFLSWVPSLNWHTSDDAGGYLCNYLLYRALQEFPDHRIGFVHVPSLSVMPIEAQLRPIHALLARCLTPDETQL
ncbi:MAG: hypothetical protein ABUL72_00230 [Armatimonadota bacterium]